MLRYVRALLTLLVLTVSISVANATPAAAASYYKTTQKNTKAFYYCGLSGPCAFFSVPFNINHRVEGVDSTLDPNKIFVREVSVSGVIKNYMNYPFSTDLTVTFGELRESAIPNYIADYKFYQTDLSTFSVIYPPSDKPWWGGEKKFLSVYMNKQVPSWQYVSLWFTAWDSVWTSNDSPEDSFTFHTINGWQNQ